MAWPKPFTSVRLRALLVALVIFGLGFALTAWRLEAAPDLFTDEILYARAGVRVAGEGALVWDRGDPIYVHPPVYFLAEAAFYRLAGRAGAPLYAPGDIFALVHHARIVNALLAGATAALFYGLGRRLQSSTLGIFLAVLFLIDPFALRTNRRAMLETLAGLLTLAGMGAILSHDPDLQTGSAPRTGSAPPIPAPSTIVAGLLLGVALLTKELTITSLPALLLFGAWESMRARLGRRARLGQETPPHTALRQVLIPMLPSLVSITIAVLTYGLYPLWMLTSGEWQGFAQVKTLSLQRLLGLVQISGWNRPGVSLVDFLLQRFADYGSTYVLMGLGGVATAWLLWRERGEVAQTGSAPSAGRVHRLLASWGVVLYPFYGFLALFGSGNDQFYYFLLLPAILLVGYAAVDLWHELWPRPRRAAWLAPAGLLLTVLLTYNGARWWTAYGVGWDNAYHRLSTFVRQELEDVEIVNATGDAIKFRYFLPDHLISAAATPAEARAVGVTTFALAPKDVEARYGRVTPTLAEWIVAHGRLLAAEEGDSYGEIMIFQVDAAALDGIGGTTGTVPTEEDLEAARPRPRRFGPAIGGFATPFVVTLGLWIVGFGSIAAGLWIWRTPSPLRRFRRGGAS